MIGRMDKRKLSFRRLPITLSKPKLQKSKARSDLADSPGRPSMNAKRHSIPRKKQNANSSILSPSECVRLTGKDLSDRSASTDDFGTTEVIIPRRVGLDSGGIALGNLLRGKGSTPFFKIGVEWETGLAVIYMSPFYCMTAAFLLWLVE